MPDLISTALRHAALASCLALAVALPAGAAQPLGCLIEAERIADVGSPVIGVVERVEVERGDRVVKGQVLAVLRAPVERATLNVAASRAQSNAEVQAAQASANFNRERLVRAEDLFRQQFISQQALDQARAEFDMADQKLALVREQRALSRQERDVAAAQVSQRVIRSPIDGVVAERYASAGERVDDKPLLRVAKVDPLRVQLVVPVSMYLQVEQGGYASVVPELPGARPMSARVTMVDKVIDPASNTFRVHLELPNPNAALPAGLRCKAEFSAAPAGSAGATPAPTPAAAPAAVPSVAAATLEVPGKPHRTVAQRAAAAEPKAN
jgi:RND family efflux transporter MFP subunit